MTNPEGINYKTSQIFKMCGVENNKVKTKQQYDKLSEYLRNNNGLDDEVASNISSAMQDYNLENGIIRDCFTKFIDKLCAMGGDKTRIDSIEEYNAYLLAFNRLNGGDLSDGAAVSDKEINYFASKVDESQLSKEDIWKSSSTKEGESISQDLVKQLDKTITQNSKVNTDLNQINETNVLGFLKDLVIKQKKNLLADVGGLTEIMTNIDNKALLNVLISLRNACNSPFVKKCEGLHELDEYIEKFSKNLSSDNMGSKKDMADCDALIRNILLQLLQ